MADFGPAFKDSRNLVVGPLALIGGAEPSPEAVVLAHEGQKYPLLVRAGHVVTLEIPSGKQETAGLAYGPLPQGRIRLRDAHRRVTFVACRPEKDSGSTADGAVTFWSGAIMTSAPDCVPLNVYVDGKASPRHAAVPVGPRPCKTP